MRTEPTTSTPSAPRSDSPTGSSQLGKDQFLRLLMAQLANQDPMAPADSQAFVAQLAQFTTLELQQATNSALDSLLVAQTAGNQVAAAGLIGKDITYQSESVELRAGTPARIDARLAGRAEEVTLAIRDESGRTVRTLRLGARDAGDLTVAWDGRDERGQALPPGRYDLTFSATDAERKPVAVRATARGRVTGISFANGYPELLVGTIRVRMGDVIEVAAAAPAAAGGALPSFPDLRVPR